MSIKRVWHWWTTKENADKYQNILSKEVLPGIEAKNISGYQKIEVLRTEHEHEVEFVTIMRFDSLDAVREFAGAAYQEAVVPEKARAVLSRFDRQSQHYEVRAERTAEG